MQQPVVLSRQLRCVSRLLTTLRDETSSHVTFSEHARRLMNLICEEGLSSLESCLRDVQVQTPTGVAVNGVSLNAVGIVAISIIRAGDSMLDSFLRICPAAQVGKILIQRNEETALPTLLFYKVPKLEGKQIVLLDPMLATGGSAREAIKVLLQNGATEDQIAFFSVISCPEGIAAIQSSYPLIRIVTGHIDEGLNSKAYIIPGLGDFGDRYFGTVEK